MCVRMRGQSPGGQREGAHPGIRSLTWVKLHLTHHTTHKLHLLSTYVGPTSGRDATWRCLRGINLPGRSLQTRLHPHPRKRGGVVSNSTPVLPPKHLPTCSMPRRDNKLENAHDMFNNESVQYHEKNELAFSSAS